jgi:hypothetical protein
MRAILFGLRARQAELAGPSELYNEESYDFDAEPRSDDGVGSLMRRKFTKLLLPGQVILDIRVHHMQSAV